MNRKIEVPDGYQLIFRKWKYINGEKVYASEYGLKAWPILIKL